MEVSKESWDAMIAGQASDVRRINDLQERLCKMARQVERLSYVAEYMDMKFKDGWTLLEEAEADWRNEEMYREALKERRE